MLYGDGWLRSFFAAPKPGVYKVKSGKYIHCFQVRFRVRFMAYFKRSYKRRSFGLRRYRRYGRR